MIEYLINRANRNLVSKNARTSNRCLFLYLYLPSTGDILRYLLIPPPNKLILLLIRDILATGFIYFLSERGFCQSE